MTDKEKLYSSFDDVIWMAIRYAHGRNTYAPDMVRKAIKRFQEVFPDWKPRKDITIKPSRMPFKGANLETDYLTDLFEEK